MAKSKKAAAYDVRKSTSDRWRQWSPLLRAAGLQGSGAVLAFICVAACVILMRGYVEREVTFPKAPPKVVLKNRPAWMTDFLAGQISMSVRPQGVHSAFDHQMLVDRVAMLKANPWIRTVREVRRAYGARPGDTLEVDCDFRAPIALVKYGRDYWLVDGEGVKLPQRFTAADVPKIVFGRDGHTNIRVVEGVQRPVPQAVRSWGGEDLAAGLEMVKRLYGLPFADEIVKVSVANFGGRVDVREAQVVLGTKYRTEIRWGQPLGSRTEFIEVRPEKKFEYLQRVYDEFGRCDARQRWIDIRFDKITYPSAEPLPGPQSSTARVDGQ